MKSLTFVSAEGEMKDEADWGWKRMPASLSQDTTLVSPRGSASTVPQPRIYKSLAVKIPVPYRYLEAEKSSQAYKSTGTIPVNRSRNQVEVTADVTVQDQVKESVSLSGELYQN